MCVCLTHLRPFFSPLHYITTSPLPLYPSQANKLYEDLVAALLPYNVQVLHDKGELEIVPRHLHKGVVVKRVLQKQAAITGAVPDFVLVIGDDVSDEKMFSSVLSYAADVDTSTVSSPSLLGPWLTLCLN